MITKTACRPMCGFFYYICGVQFYHSNMEFKEIDFEPSESHLQQVEYAKVAHLKYVDRKEVGWEIMKTWHEHLENHGIKAWAYIVKSFFEHHNNGITPNEIPFVDRVLIWWFASVQHLDWLRKQ